MKCLGAGTIPASAARTTSPPSARGGTTSAPRSRSFTTDFFSSRPGRSGQTPPCPPGGGVTRHGGVGRASNGKNQTEEKKVFRAINRWWWRFSPPERIEFPSLEDFEIAKGWFPRGQSCRTLPCRYARENADCYGCAGAEDGGTGPCRVRPTPSLLEAAISRNGGKVLSPRRTAAWLDAEWFAYVLVRDAEICWNCKHYSFRTYTRRGQCGVARPPLDWREPTDACQRFERRQD